LTMKVRIIQNLLLVAAIDLPDEDLTKNRFKYSHSVVGTSCRFRGVRDNQHTIVSQPQIQLQSVCPFRKSGTVQNVNKPLFMKIDRFC
jgi:hypothetical protein